MMDMGIILLVLTISLGGNLWMLVRQTQLRGLIRSALRKAEQDRCEWVRIPYNQLAKMMGWHPEFEEYRDWRTKDTEYARSSAYPMRRREPSGHTKHPATLSPTRRGKLA